MTFRIETETIAIPFPVTEISWQGFDIDGNDNWLAVKATKAGLRLVSAWNEVPLDLEIEYATVRCLGDKALIVSGRIGRQGQINAWIVDPNNGDLITRFSVGDGVQDVLVLDDYIAVSYFDEGVLGHTLPSREGIAIFDHVGKYLWGYATAIHNPVYILDCYAMCPTARNSLAFFAYTDFHLVDLDVSKQIQTVIQIPPALRGCSAISRLKNTTFFRGPYPQDNDYKKPRETVFAFDIKGGQVCEVDNLPGGYVRGLSNGRMLSVSDRSVVIVSFRE